MDCLELLSKYFKYLSSKSNLRLEITFDPFENVNINETDQEILENIKQCLVESNFCSTKLSVKSSVKSKNVCEICKKQFSCQEILEFHLSVVHNQDGLQEYNIVQNQK